jgi:hypothetical protein
MSDILTNIFDVGLNDFTHYLNPLFMVVLVLSMWLLNDSIDSTSFMKNFSRFSKIPRMIRSVIPSVVWGIIFYWVFRFNNRIEVFDLILSTLAALVAYELGICKVLRSISVKIFKMKFANEN